MTMTRRSYLLDDTILLNDLGGRWFLDSLTELPAPANRRSTLIQTPGMDGGIPVDQGAGTGTVTVSLIVTEKPGEAGRSLNTLQALLSGASTITRLDDGWAQTTDIYSVVLPDPQWLGQGVIRVQAVFTVAPFWRAAGDPVEAHPISTNGTAPLGMFDGCTAPLVDAVVRVSGPYGWCHLTNGETGLLLDKSLASGRHVFVDLAAWKAWESANANAWTKPDTGLTVPDYPAGGPLKLRPQFHLGDLATMLTINAGNTGTTFAVTVRGGRWYL